ncbi:MAG: YggS family pyridoxal phosphate-dependent enzyme [Candidatus Omnitrophica bacterium]|nr:YggS family pyridoxal phosphate-dependent enzyme [Candidatus Omnitrophota bacterium]
MQDHKYEHIAGKVKAYINEIPRNVTVVAAAKKRDRGEIRAAIDAGIRIIGENYVQETEKVYPGLKDVAKWHLIGALQKNKVKKAVMMFDMIETVDSVELAGEIDKRCGGAGKIMPVLLEINTGLEGNKSGIIPEDVKDTAKTISAMKNIRIEGLMTMGPLADDPELSRPYFRIAQELFLELKGADIPGVEMKYLSMGMTASYRVAIAEGANLVRIGTGIFGER